MLLLEEQNREAWDQEAIRKGLWWLARSAEGDSFSRYHAEAGIAAEHCLAPCLQETRWDRVAESYSLLEHFTGSPIHRLNRAVAMAEWRGPKMGLEVLEGFEPPSWLAGSYQWAAVLADLYRRSGDVGRAEHYCQVACKVAPSPQLQQLLQRRLQGGRE